MKIFISWSGERSLEIATVLHDWIPYVIQAVRPFVSSGDIEKGQHWNQILGSELSQAEYGIICVTADNLRAPWLHFEAGAISKTLDQFVSPFLFRVEPGKIDGPFEQFQATVYTKEDVFRLMRSINSRMNENQLPLELLRSEFETWWPELEKKLDQIAKKPTLATQTGYNWLYTIDDLVSVCATDKAKSVWWITPNLWNYALKSPCKELLERDLGAGLKYSFVVSETMNDGEETLRRLKLRYPGAVSVSEVPDDRFHSLAATDYLIVDPDDDARVFLELPINPRGYWIKVEEGPAAGFVDRFRGLVQADSRSAGVSSAPH